LVEQVNKMDITLLTCQQLIDEISGVSDRPKFRKILSREIIREFITLHIKICQVITLEVIPEILSDKKDNFLLALYHEGKASLLITGDKLLFEEAMKKEINVGTWAQFKEYINEPNPR